MHVRTYVETDDGGKWHRKVQLVVGILSVVNPGLGYVVAAPGQASVLGGWFFPEPARTQSTTAFIHRHWLARRVVYTKLGKKRSRLTKLQESVWVRTFPYMRMNI